MPRSWWMNAALVAALGGLAVACGDDDDDDSAADDDTSASDDDTSPSDTDIANQLWADIQGYTTWGMPPGWSSTPMESGAHMGAFVVAYINTTMASWDMTGVAPEGALAVKEGYDDALGTTLTGITVMQKRAGYNPDASDWFWAMYDGAGAVMEAGAVESCIDCHEYAYTDYVFYDLPTP